MDNAIESKSEKEKLLRKAMDEYEGQKVVAKTENITLGELLDVWVDEKLKEGCAGALGTLGSKYHNKYLRPRYKGSQEEFSNAS